VIGRVVCANDSYEKRATADDVKIHFLVPRLDKASTRYRVLQYLPVLEAAGFSCAVQALSGQRRQWAGLISVARAADVIFIQKKLFSTVELFLLRRFAHRLVYDYDDSVMLKDGPASERQHARQSRRFAATVKRADLVIAGNSYLREQALPVNPNVKVLPTPLDMQRYGARPGILAGSETVTLGWIGSRGTLKYLNSVSAALEAVGRLRPNARLKIVADDFFDLEHLPVIKKRWAQNDEITDLHSFDIGLMPLTDDPWTRGKCGFKLLQCMAVGIPVITSPVGVNREIVTDGCEGFWASTTEEWIEKMIWLIDDLLLRQRMGMASRKKVLSEYSLQVNAPRLITWLHDQKG
jgi:glycosyltransferase involved in cell wall biosynthesis